MLIEACRDDVENLTSLRPKLTVSALTVSRSQMVQLDAATMGKTAPDPMAARLDTYRAPPTQPNVPFLGPNAAVGPLFALKSETHTDEDSGIHHNVYRGLALLYDRPHRLL